MAFDTQTRGDEPHGKTHATAHGAAPGHRSGMVRDLPMERVSAKPAFLRGFIPTVQDVWAYRELLGQLVRKELKIKYKDSVLGFFWTLLRPLLMLLVYSIAIGTFLGNSKNIPEFGVFLYTGLLAWALFTDIIGGCTGTIISNAGLVKKVYFPRELFPLSVVGAAFINFLLQFVVLIGAYVVTWHPPTFSTDLLLVPLAVLVMVFFAFALGLVLGAVNVYLRDVEYLVEVTLLLWFWMTPIVYDWTKVHNKMVCQGGNSLAAVRGLQGYNHLPPIGSVKSENACYITDNHLIHVFQIYLANPMANVVLAFQRALWPGGRTEKGSPFYYSGDLFIRLGVLLGVCVVLVWIAQRIFARAQGNFAQEL
ncbi:MAG: ABC transporter permease [Mycobacteriales bacterium]